LLLKAITYAEIIQFCIDIATVRVVDELVFEEIVQASNNIALTTQRDTGQTVIIDRDAYESDTFLKYHWVGQPHCGIGVHMDSTGLLKNAALVMYFGTHECDVPFTINDGDLYTSEKMINSNYIQLVKMK
jgi:hypothetical protein